MPAYPCLKHERPTSAHSERSGAAHAETWARPGANAERHAHGTRDGTARRRADGTGHCGARRKQGPAPGAEPLANPTAARDALELTPIATRVCERPRGANAGPHGDDTDERGHEPPPAHTCAWPSAARCASRVGNEWCSMNLSAACDEQREARDQIVKRQQSWQAQGILMAHDAGTERVIWYRARP